MDVVRSERRRFAVVAFLAGAFLAIFVSLVAVDVAGASSAPTGTTLEASERLPEHGWWGNHWKNRCREPGYSAELKSPDVGSSSKEFVWEIDGCSRMQPIFAVGLVGCWDKHDIKRVKTSDGWTWTRRDGVIYVFGISDHDLPLRVKVKFKEEFPAGEDAATAVIGRWFSFEEHLVDGPLCEPASPTPTFTAAPTGSPTPSPSPSPTPSPSPSPTPIPCAGGYNADLDSPVVGASSSTYLYVVEGCAPGPDESMTGFTIRGCWQADDIDFVLHSAGAVAIGVDGTVTVSNVGDADLPVSVTIAFLQSYVAGANQATVFVNTNGAGFEFTPDGPDCAGETVTQQLEPGGTATTDTEGDGATPADPLESSVMSPNAGAVTITEASVAGAPPAGFTFFGQQADITAPPASAADPLVLSFRLDATILPPGGIADVQVFKDEVLVGECPSAAQAIPDPCISARVTLADGDGEITVLTSTASAWNFGVADSTPTPTDSPTPAPTDTPTATPTDSPTPAPTDTPTATPTDSPTPAPTDTPTPTPTDTPTPTPTDSPTPTPTDSPTPTPTDTPTPTPTDSPTPTPTDSPTPAPTDTPTPSLGPNDVARVAIDLEPNGPSANTGTSIGGGGAGIDAGDVTSMLENVPLNTPFTVDIVVDQIPAEGIQGIGGEVTFNGAVIRLVNPIQTSVVPSLHFSSTCGGTASPAPFEVFDARPSTSGAWRFDSADLSSCFESGPGLLLRFHLECTAVGTTAVGLTDTITGGQDTIGLLGGPNALYDVVTETEAVVHCGQPAPASAGATVERSSSNSAALASLGWSRFKAGWI